MRGNRLQGSNYRAMAVKNLVFWIGGRLWEVVANERWSHLEVRLYLNSSFRGMRQGKAEKWCKRNRKTLV